MLLNVGVFSLLVAEYSEIHEWQDGHINHVNKSSSSDQTLKGQNII